MKVTKFGLKQAATKIAKNVIVNGDYITLNDGFMFAAVKAFGCKPFSKQAYNVGVRLNRSINDRFGIDFWCHNGWNFDAHSDS